MVSGVAVPPGQAEREALELRLLGEFQVRVGGEPVAALRSGRPRSLLAYLVLHPDAAHSRQRLAFAFWPDSSEDQARTNLRNVLHTLRRAHPALDASIEVTPTTIQWRPDGSAEVDVERFVAAAAEATASDPDEPGALIERCRVAADSYAGDLLEGDHDEWVLSPREELRDRYRAVLRALGTALIDDGRAQDATAVARDLVRADPLDEAAHLLRIEAHQAAGDRAGAVRAFHECVATLERELGVEPGPATLALYASLVDKPATDPAARPRPKRGQTGLVGRDEEWRRLTDAWAHAQAGAPAVVMVTGEPGIGKTRIVEELRAWCAESGAAIGYARSYATEGDLGFAVITAWLRSPNIRAAFRHLAQGERAQLCRLLPELGPGEASRGTDEAEQRRRLFDASVTALAAAARPTLLVADDAQWSDQASQELIHYLVRSWSGGPLLVVLTARQEDLDAAHPLTALRDALAARECLTELHLERLTRAATEQLGEQLHGAALAPDARDTLYAESEGNPLFVVETMRGGWDSAPVAVSLSPRLRAVIDARLRRLSPEATEIAAAAAVVGEPCSANLLGRLSALDDRSLAQGLDELWRRGIFIEAGTDAYDFSHGKLREAVYDALSPAARRAHHSAVAEALARSVSDAGGWESGLVAAHFEAAHRAAEAVEWFQRAALDAEGVFAYAEAVRMLDRALALVPALPADVRHVRELELLSTLPVALAGVDGYATDRMEQAHLRATEVAVDLGVALEPSLVRSMVMWALCRDEFAAAAQAAGTLLSNASDGGDLALRAESHYLLGISAFWGADLDGARQHFETVVTDFDASMRPRHHVVYGHDAQVVCLSRLANTLWFLGHDEDARSTCDDAMALAAQVGHPLSHDTAAIFSCLLALDLDDHDRLRGATAQLGALSMDSLPHHTKRDALLGLVDVLDGRPAAGIARVRAAFDGCQGRNFYPGFRATIMRVLLAAHVAADDYAGGLAVCAEALAMGSTTIWDAEIHRCRAEFLHATAAAPTEVKAALDAAAATARHQHAGGHLRRIEATEKRLLPAT